MNYYTRELEEFKEQIQRQVIGQSEVIKIVNKLCRHFKLPKMEVVFRKHGPNSGTCFTRSGIVSFHPKVTSIWVICHEVGHWMDACKNKPKKWHTKKHRTYTKRLLRYCEKMNYWSFVIGGKR